MKSLKPSLRRLAAIAGAAVIGITAALAIASPASAHHPNVYGEYECVDATGQWKVTWKVVGSEDDLEGKVTGVTFDPAFDAKVIVVGATVPESDQGSLVEEQLLPASATGASLKVAAEWWRDGQKHYGEDTATVTFSEECGTTKASATFEPDCEGKVVVNVENSDKATKDAVLTIFATGFDTKVVLAPGQKAGPWTVEAGAGKITILEEGRNEPLAEYTWTEPKGCGIPELEVTSTCDELIFKVINPENGPDIDATFTPSTGEAKNLKLGPGETGEVKFAASAGLTVVISEGEDQSEPIAWEEPADCTPLPQTGANVTGAATAAGVLLIAGAGLFYVFRRRRIRFTA